MPSDALSPGWSISWCLPTRRPARSTWAFTSPSSPVCPRTDKGSADVTFVRKAEASGHCTVLPDSPVLRIEAGPDQRVRSVVFMHDGRRESVRTRVLVLACGAVETPRLLLLSEGTHAAGGLANEHGQVGKHFMETLSWVSSGLHPDDLGSHRGVPSDGKFWRHQACARSSRNTAATATSV